jgi:hypothetical protein
MSESLWIGERVERQACVTLAAAHATWMAEELAAGRTTSALSALAGVHRYDNADQWTDQTGFRGRHATKTAKVHGDVIVAIGDLMADVGAAGDSGTVHWRMPIDVMVWVRHPESDADNPSFVWHRWVRRILTALLADPRLTETGTSEVLTEDIQPVAALRLPAETGEPEFVVIVSFQAQFETDRTDPTTGPGLTAQAV